MQPPKRDIERVAMLKKFSDLDRGRRMRSPGRAEFAAQQRSAGHMKQPENVGQDIDAAGSRRSVIEKGHFRQEIGRLGTSGAPNSALA